MDLLELESLVDQAAQSFALEFRRVLFGGLNARGDDQQQHPLLQVVGGDHLVIHGRCDVSGEGEGAAAAWGGGRRARSGLGRGRGRRLRSGNGRLGGRGARLRRQADPGDAGSKSGRRQTGDEG